MFLRANFELMLKNRLRKSEKKKYILKESLYISDYVWIKVNLGLT